MGFAHVPSPLVFMGMVVSSGLVQERCEWNTIACLPE